jgi:hypothetical protein
MTSAFDAAAVLRARSEPLLEPLGWAAASMAMVADNDPNLLVDLLTLSCMRMHLIALALTHVETEAAPELGRLLLRGPVGEILSKTLGRGPPAGLGRALAHMPSYVLARESYRRLIELLDHQASAHLLFYADRIDTSIIELLYRVPAPLRRPALLLAMRRGGGFSQLAGFAEGLAVLAARGAAPSFDALVSELALAWGPAQFASKLEAVVERLPPVEAVLPRRIGLAVRQDSLTAVRAISARFENYIADYLKSFKQAECAVYHWNDSQEPAVCLVRRHGRFGWFLDVIKGQGNAEVEPERLGPIHQEFAAAGIPRSSAIEPVERLYNWVAKQVYSGGNRQEAGVMARTSDCFAGVGSLSLTAAQVNLNAPMQLLFLSLWTALPRLCSTRDAASATSDDADCRR